MPPSPRKEIGEKLRMGVEAATARFNGKKISVSDSKAASEYARARAELTEALARLHGFFHYGRVPGDLES